MQKRLINLLSSEKTAQRVAVAVFVIILALVAFGQLSYNDFWWHLAAGKWMFSTRSFLQHDIFSVAFQGKEWLNGTWIFDGLLYLIFTKTSFWGLNILRFVVFSASYFFFIIASRIKNKAPLTVCVAVFLLTLPMIRNFLRPEITFPLFVGITLYTLLKFKYSRSKIIFLLPLVEAIWVNTHGSFQWGIMFIGIFLVSELARSLIRYRTNIVRAFQNNRNLLVYFLTLLLSIFASFINPLGYRIYQVTFQILSDRESLSSILEWHSFSLSGLFNFSALNVLPFAGLALICFLILILKAVKIWKKYRSFITVLQNFFYEDILILGFALLSVQKYTRLSSMFALIAAFIIVKNYHILSNVFGGHNHRVELILLPLSVLLVITLQKPIFTLSTGPNEFSRATESIDFIKKNNLHPNYINEYADGGDLIWQLYPKYHVFIDGRTPNVYDNDFYWYYRNIGKKGLLDAIIDRYTISFAITPIGSGLQQMFSKIDNWSLVFFDNYEAVFIRNDGPDKKIAEQYTYAYLNPLNEDKSYLEYCSDTEKKKRLIEELKQNMADLNKPVYSSIIFSTLLTECTGSNGRDKIEAESLMQKVVSYQPSNLLALSKLGSIEISLDKNAEAVNTFKRAVKLQKNKIVMTGLGIALHNLGKYKEAEKIFKQVPFLLGDVPNEYYQIYGRVSYQLDYNERAIELFHHYDDLIETDKITAQDYLDLSNAYKDNSQQNEAQKYADMAKNFKVTTSTKDFIN